MTETLATALSEVFTPAVLLIILLSAVYGIFVGSIPGLTATMAVALMVPITFFLDDVPALAAIVTLVACTIFAGDIPTTLVRIPGTPSSAAYCDDAYALTQMGRQEQSLGVSLLFSVIGGLLGAVVLIAAAPQLARFAFNFSAYEYFWLVVLGLSCAAIVSHSSLARGLVALFIGWLLSTVGLSDVHAQPRFTFGSDELITGINFIPAMIGLFGVSEVLRNVLRLGEVKKDDLAAGAEPPEKGGWFEQLVRQPIRSVFGEAVGLLRRRMLPLLRASAIGSFVGMLPGAGADIAAWISYAVSKRFSSQAGEYGKGSLEGIGDATGANNAALAGAWIPALVFGIPGDSVTAIVIGVLLMKNITPGPEIFTDPQSSVLVYAIYIVFVLANLVLIPVGLIAIRTGSLLVRVPRSILMPVILLFCLVGAYAISGNYFDLWVMGGMGVLGFILEAYRVPLGPVVLGIILGGQLEQRFVQCLTIDSSPAAFFSRPIAATLGVLCILLWVAPLVVQLKRRLGGGMKDEESSID